MSESLESTRESGNDSLLRQTEFGCRVLLVNEGNVNENMQIMHVGLTCDFQKDPFVIRLSFPSIDNADDWFLSCDMIQEAMSMNETTGPIIPGADAEIGHMVCVIEDEPPIRFVQVTLNNPEVDNSSLRFDIPVDRLNELFDGISEDFMLELQSAFAADMVAMFEDELRRSTL